MNSTENNITYDNLPQAVAQLLKEVRDLRALTMSCSARTDTSPWMDVEQLCEYLPGHPAKGTIYSWVRSGSIPHHRCGKTICFNRPEIDKWIKKQ